MSIETTTNPILAVANALLHRGSDGGVPIERNDVGYNRVDYPLVRSILASVERQDGVATRGQLRGLLAVLRKYHRQLGELGYDLATLEAAVADGAERAPVTAPVVTPPVAPTLKRDDRDDDVAAWAAQYDEPGDSDDDAPPRPIIPPMADVLGPGGIIAQKLPGYEPRPSQIQLAQAIADAITHDETILAEAGTGTGKSLAYLIPAIYSGKKVIVSTEGKALQDQLRTKDVPFLKATLPIPFSFAVLKGISNYVCALKWDEEAHGLGMLPGFAELTEWYKQTETGDLAEAPVTVLPELQAAITTTSDDCLGIHCSYADQCFVLKAKQRAKEARVVIVNHTLLCLDLALREATEDGIAILPDRDLIVIDEVHALESVATEAFAEVLTDRAVPSTLRGRLPALANLDDDDLEQARAINDAFFQIVGRDERTTYRIEPNEDLRLKAMALAKRLRAMARQSRQAILDAGGYDDLNTDVSRPLVLKRIGGASTRERQDNVRRELYAQRLENLADRFLKCTEPLDTHVIFVEKARDRRDQERITLKRAPISVADDLASALWSRWPVVATSATLTTSNGFAYFRERVGCDDAREITVPSPFDFRRNALLYLPANSAEFDPTRYYQEGSVEYYDRLAHQIEQLLLASDGRAFCLFTSRKALDEIYSRIAHRLRWNVYRQGDYGLAETIRRFREDGHAVLFGLKSYWTGVDVAGDALSLVIIDKIPFAQPDDPVFEARKDDLTRRTGDRWAWWNRLAVPAATIALKQGIGRLIRTKTDRGVIALLDGRLLAKAYGASILRSLPPATQTRSIEAVRAFFETH